MRKAAASLRLQAKSNLVIDTHCDHGSSRVRCDHYAESVFESFVPNRNLQWLHAFASLTLDCELLFAEILESSAIAPFTSRARMRAARRFNTRYASRYSGGALF